jgi:hypothetical protein
LDLIRTVLIAYPFALSDQCTMDLWTVEHGAVHVSVF